MNTSSSWLTVQQIKRQLSAVDVVAMRVEEHKFSHQSAFRRFVYDDSSIFAGKSNDAVVSTVDDSALLQYNTT